MGAATASKAAMDTAPRITSRNSGRQREQQDRPILSRPPGASIAIAVASTDRSEKGTFVLCDPNWERAAGGAVGGGGRVGRPPRRFRRRHQPDRRLCRPPHSVHSFDVATEERRHLWPPPSRSSAWCGLCPLPPPTRDSLPPKHQSHCLRNNGVPPQRRKTRLVIPVVTPRWMGSTRRRSRLRPTALSH